MSIWDDHDYGLDDAGGDWPLKNLRDFLNIYGFPKMTNEEVEMAFTSPGQ